MKKSKLLIAVLLSLTIVTYSATGILKWLKDNEEEKRLLEKLKTYKYIDNNILTEAKIPKEAESSVPAGTESEIKIDFPKLKQDNADVVGWLTIENTKIDYPVVQAKDNSYYLNHSFLKKENEAGSIFLDYRNDLENIKKNTIIYGHARVDGSMFGSLEKLLMDKNSHIIELSTPLYKSKWQIFSAYTIAKESYYLTTKFINENSYLKFIDKILKRSKQQFDTDTTNIDNILTLSTCKDNFSHRIVIHAKLIEKEP